MGLVAVSLHIHTARIVHVVCRRSEEEEQKTGEREMERASANVRVNE